MFDACILSFALLALSAVAARAAKSEPPAVPAAWLPGFERIRESELRADLGFIASDALMGRMSLEPGDAVGVAWIAAEFAKAGLTPAVPTAGGGAGFLQAVPLLEYRADGDGSFLALTRNGIVHRFSGEDFLGGYHDDVEATAGLVFAGYGITASGLGYDDYRGIDARGRIVLVFEHEPQETDPHSRFNGTGNTRHATTRVKALNAQAHGALALVVIPEPNRQHPSSLERYQRIGGSATRTPSLPSQALIDDALTIPVVTVSDALAAELLATAGSRPQALQAAIDADLSSQARMLPDTTVTLHLQNRSRTRGTTYNVAGLLPGRDPHLAGETIIISAHHDHDGATDDDGGGRDIWHGADDNGSGTVGVVELARAFAVNGVRPRRSILFVVFGAEERGLLGSFFMAAHPLRPLATTRAMINFDMIGRDEAVSDQTTGLIDIPADTHNRLNLIGASYSPDFERVVIDANRTIGLDLDARFDRENALNTFFRSDQFPFVLRDVPAFWFFTGFHPDYHQITDTADRIDYPKMTRILELAYLSAWHVADDAAVPRFVPDPPGVATPGVPTPGH